jgi:formiminotetrahydrofolate cyclodeaminase
MSESLWAMPVSELLSRTASSDPTPGGGSISAISGGLGVGLLRMAVAVTADESLAPVDALLAALQTRIMRAADADVRDFEALMAAYRLPREDDAQGDARSAAIEDASVDATEGPFGLVGALLQAIELSHDLEPAVKRGVVSDVLAGRDLIAGSARAAIRTADINLEQLDRSSSARAPELRERRDELARRLEAAA